MRFEIKGVRIGGGFVRFALDALDAEDASAQAGAQGVSPIAIRPARSWRRLQRTRTAPLPLLLFSQELLALLEAGLALVESIETLAEKEARPELRRVLAAVVARLREGQPLSYGLEHCGGNLPPLFIASVRASEHSGALAEALARYIDYQTQIERVRRHLAGAAVYPLILVVVGGVVTLFLLFYVVPRFSQVYADVAGPLPLPSRLMMGWGAFLSEHASALLLAGAAGLALAVSGLAQAAARTWLMQRVWRLPALGERLRLFYLSRLYRSLGMLLRGGMPIGTAMAMASDLLQGALRDQFLLATARIREGQSISQAMHAHGLTTPVAQRMLRVGERTGAMGEMMERIAAFYEEDTARWIERFTKLFEPMLMMAIGLLIGGIVVLMYLPIFDLAGAIQ